MLGVNVRTPSTYKDVKVPDHYIPGHGRGAMGFTTRSDIGPARGSVPGASSDKPPPGYIPGAGRGATGLADSVNKGVGDRSTEDLSESNYDSFAGYGGSLFGDAPLEADDLEAERVYAEVDEIVGRRKRSRAAAAADAAAAASATGGVAVGGGAKRTRAPIAEQFSDLKADLAKVSAAEWESIKDIGDTSYKGSKRESYAPVPDSVLASGMGGGLGSSAAGGGGGGGGGGLMSSVDPSGSHTDIRSLAAARGTALSFKLDKVGDSVAGQTVVNPQGYLTELATTAVGPAADIKDVKKGRLLMQSMLATNPKEPNAWVAAARFEESVMKLSAARDIILQGTEQCPDSEDVWLEAVRLALPSRTKVILADAVRQLPTSVNLWLRAAALETDPAARKAVLHRALELVPTSVALWRTAIELEEPEEARVLLTRAVDCVPQNLDLWLALARLEPYDRAKAVLNKARSVLPAEPAIWVAACKLEETHGSPDRLPLLVKNALRSLAAHSAKIDRRDWIRFAEDAERDGAVRTAAALVEAVLPLGVDEEDRRRTWLAGADAFDAAGLVHCTRAAYALALAHFPSLASLWLRAATLEEKHGSPDQQERLLREAVRHCPRAEFLWLKAAAQKRDAGDLDGAREILAESFKFNPGSDTVWLAAAKLEWDAGEHERARALLARARERAGTERVWMKSAMLERELAFPVAGEAEEALLTDGLRAHPTFDKLWLMLGQLLERRGDDARARDMLLRAVRHCPRSTPLWRLAARLEERVSGLAKARTLLEQARLTHPAQDLLWLDAIRLEARAENPRAADALLAKAQQECPSSGLLWAERIARAPRAEQKGLCEHAVKTLPTDPHVLLQGARLFWRDRKYPAARRWFDRAVALDADLGDAWAAYFRFERAHGTDADQTAVLQRCVAAKPRHGELWTTVSKRVDLRRAPVADILPLVAELVPIP